MGYDGLVKCHRVDRSLCHPPPFNYASRRLRCRFKAVFPRNVFAPPDDSVSGPRPRRFRRVSVLSNLRQNYHKPFCAVSAGRRSRLIRKTIRLRRFRFGSINHASVCHGSMVRINFRVKLSALATPSRRPAPPLHGTGAPRPGPGWNQFRIARRNPRLIVGHHPSSVTGPFT